jgi:hypothetical protein
VRALAEELTTFRAKTPAEIVWAAIANDPTYPLFHIAVWVAGAEIGDDPR